METIDGYLYVVEEYECYGDVVSSNLLYENAFKTREECQKYCNEQKEKYNISCYPLKITEESYRNWVRVYENI